MAGVVECERYALEYLARLAHVDRHHVRHESVHILLLVERLEEVLALRAALLVHVLEVAPLEEAGVLQQHGAEIDRGLPCEHLAVEAMAHKLRQVAGVVDVRMRKNHRVDLRGIHRHVAVLLERLLAVALVKAAVEKNALAVGLHEMHGAGGRLRSAVERDLHGLSLLPCLWLK